MHDKVTSDHETKNEGRRKKNEPETQHYHKVNKPLFHQHYHSPKYLREGEIGLGRVFLVLYYNHQNSQSFFVCIAVKKATNLASPKSFLLPGVKLTEEG